MMEHKEMSCHACGGKMHRDVKAVEIAYKGESMTVNLPGWYCASCDEAVHSGLDMEVSDKALHELKAKVEGLLTPHEIKEIRKRLKLSQAAAGKYLGGGPRAFQKYESGSVMVSKPMSNLLFLLNKQPAMLDELKRHTHV